MSVASIEFLAFVLIGSSLFFYLPGVRARQLFLAASNAAFLWLLIPNAASLAALAAFLLSGYGAAALLSRRPSSALFTGYLVALVAAFLVLKKYEILGLFLPPQALDHPIAVVGLSYMLFRQIHFVVDAMQGQAGSISLWAYLNYQLNLFTILSGPIQRYQDFAAFFGRISPLLSDLRDVMGAYLRIFIGIFKLVAVAALCLSLNKTFITALGRADSGVAAAGAFLGMFYSYPAYIYFNFSGYCDVVIGAAALFGAELPENFERPYLARNMIDYWNRWHRTLSFWIRDYVFTPMYKAIAERWPRRAPSLAFLCFFVALFLAGVWHGSRMNWVVFGLLNGAGVSAAKLWETWIVKRRGRAGLKAYLASRPIQVGAIALNAHFACLTMLFFRDDLGSTLRLIEVLFGKMAGAR